MKSDIAHCTSHLDPPFQLRGSRCDRSSRAEERRMGGEERVLVRPAANQAPTTLVSACSATGKGNEESRLLYDREKLKLIRLFRLLDLWRRQGQRKCLWSPVKERHPFSGSAVQNIQYWHCIMPQRFRSGLARRPDLSAFSFPS
jgi:hypothetical protein